MESNKFKNKTIAVSGATIHFWTNDNVGKPAVVLLHGAAMDHLMFQQQLEVLQDYYVIAWDARGHGESRPVSGQFGLADLATDCLSILNELKISKAVLIGQSEGGMIAQEVYRLHPQRVKAIVAIGASPIMLSYTKFDMWLLKLSTNIIKAWPYNNFMKALAKKTAIKPATQAYAMRTVKNISKQDFVSIWEGVTSSISHQGISNMHISVPLLITYGEKDTTGTVRKNNMRWKAHEPNAMLVVIPDAGHNANQDNVKFFNSLLMNFLSKL